MFDTLGRGISRYPLLAVLLWVALTVGCAALAVVGVGGDTLFERLSSGAPQVPGSDSERAEQLIAEGTTAGESLTLAVAGAPVDSPGLPGAVEALREDLLAVGGVEVVIDPFVVPEGPQSPAVAPLLAQDGDGFLVVVELAKDLPDEEADASLDAVVDLLRAAPERIDAAVPGATGQVGAGSLMIGEITAQVEQDLQTGEAVALPIALVIMVLVFGGFIAAGIPMAGALASIASGLGALYGLSHLMELDPSTVNVVTVLAIGLSIDYGLLIVSRFREELSGLVAAEEAADPAGTTGRRRPRSGRRSRRDPVVTDALRRTMRTAGRTVFYSAVIVAISVSGLIVFRPEILRAFGTAGVAVILIAVATALTLVPALLRLAGRRLVRPGPVHKVPGLRWVIARTGDVSREEGVFSRLAAKVQRRPVLVCVGTVLALLVLAFPVTGMDLRNSTTELLPTGSSQRAYLEAITENYPASAAPPVIVVAEATVEDVEAWATDLAEVPDVAAVDPPQALGGHVVVGVRPDTTDAGGNTAQDVVRGVRGLDAPFPVWVTGQAANQIDFAVALVDQAPLAIGIVVIATFVLLFLMTGSVVIPVKALLTNTVSIAASLGVLVWAFQDGHLADVLGFVPTGGIEVYIVALVIAFGFGLAMDYEVFLLARIKEAYDAGASNDEAVRRGLQRSGRIITSAALIIIVVFSGFIAGELLVIKQAGFALAVAVLIDATIVRMLLVPATMTLLGRYNWWAPRPLRAIHRRFAITH